MRILWVSSFWDGPLSGICLDEERKYWFQCIHETDDDLRDRTFEILDLPEEEMRKEEEVKALFEKYVGNNCTYDEFGRRAIGDLRPASEHHKFYGVPHPSADLSKGRRVKVVSEDELRGRK